MGQALERYDAKRPGIRAVLRSSGVRGDLGRRAQAVANAARPELDDPDIFLIADTQVGRNRAGATVIGVPMRLEVDHRILGRAIDAAG